MTSFQFVSFLTYIPVDETHDMNTTKAFNNYELFCGYSEKLIKCLFDICCKGNTFAFNGKLYKQNSAAPMGGCVLPTQPSGYVTVHRSSSLCSINAM